MHLKVGIFIGCIAMQLILLQADGKLASTDLDEAINEGMKRESLEPLHKLSRQRRYLVFPEGSSFQFVYDLVVAVVDHVNYITVSITLALAWALPSEPPSELLELTKDRLRDVIEQPPTKQPLVIDDALKAGTPSIKRIADTSSRVPFNDITRSRFVPSSIGQSFRIPSHQYLDIQVQNKNPFSWDRLHSTSTKSNPFYQPISKSNHLNYPWWSVQNNVGQFQQKPIPSLLSYQQPYRDHRIIPIFGKQAVRHFNGTHSRLRRRCGIISDIPTDVDRIHIRHHRRTRHDLYEAIEKYLDKKKLKGHYCILRALCETGQKSSERKPGSFVGELMRAMFTLPEPLEDEIAKHRMGFKEQSYDVAHAVQGSCADHYSQCEHSLWTSHFVH